MIRFNMSHPFRKDGPAINAGPKPRFLALIGLGQRAVLRIEIALAQARPAVLERLLDAIDEDVDRRSADLERIAVPDHHVAAAAGLERAELAAQAERLGRPGADRREGRS